MNDKIHQNTNFDKFQIKNWSFAKFSPRRENLRGLREFVFSQKPNLCHFCHETLVLFFCVGFWELSHLTRDWAQKKRNVDTSWANAQNDSPTKLCISMTSLLMHTVAHSTRPSFRLKINNQPLKKFLSLAVSWVKVVKNGKILTFKVNFLCQKLSESF